MKTKLKKVVLQVWALEIMASESCNPELSECVSLHRKAVEALAVEAGINLQQYKKEILGKITG